VSGAAARRATARRSFVSDVLAALDGAGIPHAIVGRPAATDVDVVVSRALVRERVVDALAQTGTVVQAVEHDSACCFVVTRRATGGAREFVRLDVWTDPDVDGLRFYPGDALLPRPTTDVAFGCALSRRIAKGDLEAGDCDVLATLYARDPGGCEREVERLWPRAPADALVRAIRAGRWKAVRRRVPALRAALRRRAVRRAPLATARRIVARQVARARHVLRPAHGLHVVLLGPDGVGKSTVVDAVREELATAFAGVAVRAVAPALSQLRDGSYRTRATHHEHERAANPHGLRPHGLATSIVKAAYWLVYYGLGHLLSVRPLLARGHLVLGHRHLVDALVDTRRYRYSGPAWLVRTLWRVVPKPDLVILLDAPAETVHERKAELTVEEIARQRRAYRVLVNGLSGIGRIVDATGARDETAARAVDLIVDWLAERVARRGTR